MVESKSQSSDAIVESEPQSPDTIAESQSPDTIANMSRAELTGLIQQIVDEKLQYEPESYEAMIQRIKQELAKPYDTSAPSLLDIVRELAAQVPPEAWADIPRDASQRYREYLYDYKSQES